MLALFHDPRFRLGGLTRRGHGAVKLVLAQCMQRRFNLAQREDLEAYLNHNTSLSEAPNNWQPFPEPKKAPSSDKLITATIPFQPEGYWMFGGGHDDTHQADMAPVTGTRIQWDEKGSGHPVQGYLIPATGIKGALAHRLAFHYNALTGIFADRVPLEELKNHTGSENSAVSALFGQACEDDHGHRGHVLIDDLFIPDGDKPKDQLVHHVAIDRFTGGARAGALFTERPFWQGPEATKLAITLTWPQDAPLDEKMKAAWGRTLQDLAEGHLQVGAGSGRGHGYLQPTRVQWHPPTADQEFFPDTPDPKKTAAP